MVRSNSFKIFSFATLLLVAIFLFPVLLSAKWETVIGLLHSDSDFFQTTLLSSIVFSLIVSIASVIIGYIIASSLRHVSLFSKAANWLSLLFIPFLLGNVSVAFIFKIIFLQSNIMNFAYMSSINTYLIVGIIQIWQFASLFTYLFWLSFQSLRQGLIEYANHAKFSKWEFQRDILIPHSKNLLVLLSLLSFVFNFYEEAKLELIFRASQGTGTELISKWLYRNFRGDISINIDFASEKIFSVSLYVLIPIIFCVIILLALLLNKGTLLFCKTRLNLIQARFNSQSSNRYKYLIVTILSAIIVLPIINVYCLTGAISFVNSFMRLYSPLFLTLLASLLAGTFAIIFGIISRLAWIEKLSSFNNFSILYIGFLFILLIVPPITLMLSGFYWIRLLDISSSTSIIIFWLLGHCFLTFPILGSFMLTNLFRVKENELYFHNVHKASLSDVIKLSFLKRFRVEFILTFIFGFSLIWNEAVLNRVFSDEIPSFVSAIIDTISGRNADFSVGIAYLSISSFFAFICIILWLMVIRRAKNILIANEKIRSK